MADSPEANRPEGLQGLFSRLGVPFDFGATTCYETQAAGDVERRVAVELDEQSPKISGWSSD